MDKMNSTDWYMNPECVEELTIEEYHNMSAVLSVMRRDKAIMDDGLEIGYYINDLDKSEGRGRFPHLKNTSRVTTLKTINGLLYDTAESIGGIIKRGYEEFVFVNNVSSRNMKHGEPGGVWELNYRYYMYVKENDLFDFGYIGDDIDDYDEYCIEFNEFYGTYPRLYGDWKFFYELWNKCLHVVADKYIDDMRRVVKRRIYTEDCFLAPCDSCKDIMDCGIYEYREKIV